jgi:hypothetical protein
MSRRSKGISAPVSQHRSRILGRTGLRNSMDDAQSSKVAFNMNQVTVNRLVPSRNSIRSSLDDKISRLAESRASSRNSYYKPEDRYKNLKMLH